MCGFALLVFCCYCLLAFFARAQPEAYNFNNDYNYTYKIYHTYSYDYKQQQPVHSSSDGEFVVHQTGNPQNNLPLALPKAVQDELQRQNIPLPPVATQPGGRGAPVRTFGSIKDARNFRETPGSQSFPAIQTQSLEREPLQSDGNQQSRKSRRDDIGVTSGRMAIDRDDEPNNPTILMVNGTNCDHGFCEQAANYPEQIILKLLEVNKALSAFFKPKVPNIRDRFNLDFENLCEVNKKIVAPKTAQNVAGTNRIVVNVKDHQQIVESEVCRENAMCRFQNYWPEGYVSKCVQKYVEVPLAVMDESGNNLIIEKFSYPSGCYCACKSE